MLIILVLLYLFLLVQSEIHFRNCYKWSILVFYIPIKNIKHNNLKILNYQKKRLSKSGNWICLIIKRRPSGHKIGKFYQVGLFPYIFRVKGIDILPIFFTKMLTNHRK